MLIYNAMMTIMIWSYCEYVRMHIDPNIVNFGDDFRYDDATIDNNVYVDVDDDKNIFRHFWWR